MSPTEVSSKQDMAVRLCCRDGELGRMELLNAVRRQMVVVDARLAVGGWWVTW